MASETDWMQRVRTELSRCLATWIWSRFSSSLIRVCSPCPTCKHRTKGYRRASSSTSWRSRNQSKARSKSACHRGLWVTTLIASSIGFQLGRPLRRSLRADIPISQGTASMQEIRRRNSRESRERVLSRCATYLSSKTLSKTLIATTKRCPVFVQCAKP